MSNFSLQDNAKSRSFEQNYSDDPLADRETNLYRGEYVMGLVEKWDELIDWDARAKSEGQFFIDVLRAHGKESVLDARTQRAEVATMHVSRGSTLTAGIQVRSTDVAGTRIAVNSSRWFADPAPWHCPRGRTRQ